MACRVHRMSLRERGFSGETDYYHVVAGLLSCFCCGSMVSVRACVTIHIVLRHQELCQSAVLNDDTPAIPFSFELKARAFPFPDGRIREGVKRVAAVEDARLLSSHQRVLWHIRLGEAKLEFVQHLNQKLE